MEHRDRIVVVGGGISGLAAAHRLVTLAPTMEVTVLEARDCIGGVIQSERTSGFILEAGPDSFLSSKPRGVDLCAELGIGDRLEGTNAAMRRTYVLHDDRLYPMPEGLTGLVPSRLEPLLASDLFSAEGKRRLAREAEIPPGSGDAEESLAGFIRRRFGDEVYDRLIEPLMAGIYAGNGELLSLDATFPQLKALEREHGSLLRGLRTRGGASARDGGARPAFLTLRSGMQEIIEALQGELPRTCIRTSSPVRTIERGARGYRVVLQDGEILDAAAVILALPSYAAADIAGHLDRVLDGALRGIPYGSTATVSVAYRLADVPRPLDGFGYIVPRREGRPVLACTWVSTKFPDRVPTGHALLRAFIGRFGQEAALAGTDDDLLALVRHELRDVLGIDSEPLLHRIFRWPRVMPQYTTGHRERLDVIADRLAGLPGLFVAGNAYGGVGIPDCIRTAEKAAEAALMSVRSEAFFE